MPAKPSRPPLPDARCEAAAKHVDNIIVACRVSEHVPEYHRQAYMSFLSGYDHAMEHQGYQELLAENEELQGVLMGLDTDEKRVLALEKLLTRLMDEFMLHKKECQCVVCKALAEFEESTKE